LGVIRDPLPCFEDEMGAVWTGRFRRGPAVRPEVRRIANLEFVSSFPFDALQLMLRFENREVLFLGLAVIGFGGV
jgi:hypothetical protein